MKSLSVCLLLVLASFAVGSWKGDDLLEWYQAKDQLPLSELDEPLDKAEIKQLALNVMEEAGHDLSDFGRCHGMTCEDGYILTALDKSERFIAQVYFDSELSRAECSSAK